MEIEMGFFFGRDALLNLQANSQEVRTTDLPMRRIGYLTISQHG